MRIFFVRKGFISEPGRFARASRSEEKKLSDFGRLIFLSYILSNSPAYREYCQHEFWRRAFAGQTSFE